MLLLLYHKIFSCELEERCEPSFPLYRNTGTRRYCPDIHNWKELDNYEIGDGYDGRDPITNDRIDKNQYNDQNQYNDRNQYNTQDRNNNRNRRPTTVMPNKNVDDVEDNY